MAASADRNVDGRSIAVVRTSRRRRPPAGSPAAPALAEKARLALATLRASGPRGLWWSVLAAAGLRRLVLYRFDATAPKGLAPLPGISVRPLTGDTVEAYRMLRPDTPEAELRRRLAAGNVCMSAWREDRIIAARWLALERAEMPYLGVAFALAGEVGYLFDAFTDPRERRAGAGAHLTDVLVDHVGQHDVDTLVHAVLPENALGRALASGRSRPIGRIGVLRLGRWRIVRLAPPPDCFRAVGETAVR